MIIGHLLVTTFSFIRLYKYNLYKPNINSVFFLVEIRNESYLKSLKGGDPTAGSPTVTLLRLHPSR